MGRQRAADRAALLQRAQLHQAPLGPLPDLLVLRLFVHARVHGAGHVGVVALGLHLLGHVRHPPCLRHPGAAPEGVGGGEVVAALPVDVRELLVQVPLLRVGADALLEQHDGGLDVDGRQHDGGELVDPGEPRVERGDHVEEPDEHPGIDGLDPIELDGLLEAQTGAAGLLLDLATHVLQRVEPVPVGGEATEAERQAARRLRREVGRLVLNDRPQRRPGDVEHAGHAHGSAEAERDDQGQREVAAPRGQRRRAHPGLT